MLTLYVAISITIVIILPIVHKQLPYFDKKLQGPPYSRLDKYQLLYYIVLWLHHIFPS